MSSNSFDPYGEHHTEDPVTREAVEAALAATDSLVKKRPVVERLFGYTLIAIMAIGLFGAVLSVIDNINTERNSNNIKTIQHCEVQLRDALMLHRPELIGDPCGTVPTIVPSSTASPTPTPHASKTPTVRHSKKRHKKANSAPKVVGSPDVVSPWRTLSRVIIKKAPVRTKTATKTKSVPAKTLTRTKTITPPPPPESTCAVISVKGSCILLDSRE